MAKELVYRVRIDYDASEAAKGAQTIDRSQEQAEQSVEKTTQAIKRQGQAQERTANSTRNYQKAQSNANQTLFSFGDLLNDSQQFQFGFAQGTRAIGNNIGFAAEQFSQISQRAGGFRNALSALGSSLLGPGGAILAINAVVTAVTVFGDELFGTTDKAADFREEMKKVRKELDLLSPRAETASSIIEGLFPDSSESENLRREVQGLINIESQLSNRIDEIQGDDGLLAQAQRRLEIARMGATELNELVSQEVISRRQAESILRNRAQIEQRALTQVNQLKEEEAALEESIQDVQKDQVTLRSQLAQREAFLNSEYGKQLQNMRDQKREMERMQEIEESRRQAAEDRRQTFDRPEGDILQPDIESNLEQIDNLMKARRQKLSQLYGIELNRFMQFEEAKTQMQKAASAQRSQIFTNALSATADLVGQAFNQSKEMAIAQTLISTYASAQKAYESQLAIPTPDAPARAAAAAAVAVAQGLARVASITSTEMGSGGGEQSSSISTRRPSTGSEGFQESERDPSRLFPASMNKANQRQSPTFIIEQKVKGRDLAIAVREGNKDLVKGTRKQASDAP